jgi:hypothetical protein
MRIPRISLRTRAHGPREVFQPLNGLKSGKDRTRWPESLDALFNRVPKHPIRTDSHRALRRLPTRRSLGPPSGPYSSTSSRWPTLRDLTTGITAHSDLTKPPVTSRREPELSRGPPDQGGKGWDSLKEVIQPHLPVRLPCYDFTPLTGHSFGTSVPCGFGQRLREHQTRVV